MGGTVGLEYEGQIAVITNQNPDRHNAFDDEMDGQLFDILGELTERDDVRAVIWRGEGPSFSSGRDVASIETMKIDLAHHELMQREHDGIVQLFDLDAPVIVALHGWVLGVSFQRALLADIRVAAEGTRFGLPETGHGVIPDTGGVARLHQMCGHGVTSDLVLTGRTMEVDEALNHGVVSRVVSADDLDVTAWEMAESISRIPTVTVKMARRVLGHLATPEVRTSMAEEMIAQTFINRSHDYAEMRRARREERPPRYRGT